MIDLWSLFKEAIGLRWLLFTALIGLIVYQCVWKNWTFFRRNNVPYLRGLPVLGAQWRVLFGREAFATSVSRLYNRFPDQKVIGFYDVGGKPNYMIRDPELIKRIGIKDFDHFMNHKFYVDTKTDSLFGRSLFMMRDHRWKSMRSRLSPAFTGSKMRLMFSLIGDVSQRFCHQLKNELTDGGNSVECDIRLLFGRFANDAIASCAFGLNTNSMQDKDNEFYKIAHSLSNFTGLRNLIKFIVMLAMPKVAQLFNAAVFSRKDSAYFRQIVKRNMEYRAENRIVRNDMIHLLMQLKSGELAAAAPADEEVDDSIGFATVQESMIAGKGGTTGHIKNWDEDDLVAQCVIFLLGGFNTVSLTLSFIAHDLAVRPTVQAKLLQEIRETTEILNGQPLSYDALQKMKYLDMVVSESMRMWPQIVVSDRLVNRVYDLDVDGERKIRLNVGDTVTFPVQGLHRDPKYFPNPDEFIPERFSDENKGAIVAGTYMPFGIGPRNCIASRFALMECKACVFHLLSNYALEMCDQTQHPMQLKISSGSVEAERGFWMRIRQRV